jgi:hypothetical protein
LGLPFSLWTLRRLAEHVVLSRPQHTITSPEYALKNRYNRCSWRVLSFIGSDPAENT